MKRTNVKSSNIVSIGYDEESQTLEVEFKNGIYQYNVPKETYEEFMEAESKGSYFHRVIKKFAANKV